MLYFLQLLRKFNLPLKLLVMFYTIVDIAGVKHLQTAGVC